MNKKLSYYAVYTKNGVNYLVKVLGDNFASDAFMQSDEAYNQIVGRSFRGIFGDDGGCATCDKGNIRRITSEEEFEQLHNSACKVFKQMEKALSIMERVRKSIPDWRNRIAAKIDMSLFESCGSELFRTEYSDVDPENPEHDEWFKELARVILKIK